MTLARNGREALDLLGSERGASVDLILSDLLMPEVRAPRPRPALPTASKTAGAHGRRARAGVGHGAGGQVVRTRKGVPVVGTPTLFVYAARTGRRRGRR